MKFVGREEELKALREAIEARERKIQRLDPRPKYSVEPVLISASPPTKNLAAEGYFSRVLSLEELFES